MKRKRDSEVFWAYLKKPKVIFAICFCFFLLWGSIVSRQDRIDRQQEQVRLANELPDNATGHHWLKASDDAKQAFYERIRPDEVGFLGLSEGMLTGLDNYYADFPKSDSLQLAIEYVIRERESERWTTRAESGKADDKSRHQDDSEIYDPGTGVTVGEVKEFLKDWEAAGGRVKMLVTPRDQNSSSH